MRFLAILLLPFILLNFSSCKSSQRASEEKVLLKTDSLNKVSRKIYLLKNKKLGVSEANGSLSYTIENNEKTSVLQYVYEKDMNQAVFDGGYKEEVVFEIPNNIAEQIYTDSELQNTKMVFGRYCNCRGKNGLYKITQGKLHVVLSKKESHFELQFKINEVPQVTTEIIN